MRRFRCPQLLAAASSLGLMSALLIPSMPAQADSVRDGQWYLRFLNVAAAQQLSEGAGVTVGLIDTGVDATHPDLAGSVEPGAAPFPGATGDGQTDIDGHGTRMAGLIVGHGHGANGSQGVLGIAPKATILPVRAGDLGSGMVPAIEWATEHGAKVVSISSGGPLPDDRERQAIEDAIAHDIVVVAGVGNSPATFVQYPASYPGVLAVAGVDENGNHGDFSVTGPAVMLAAPGADILSTVLNHGYGYAIGTSDSTAIVAGAVALVRARFPKLSAAEVINRLTATAIDKGPPGRDDVYGYGIVNIVGALTVDVPPLAASPSAKSGTSTATRERSAGPGRTGLLIALGAVIIVAALWAIVMIKRRQST